MRIREPTIDDAEALAWVHIAAWQAGYDGQLPATFLAAQPDNIARRIERWRQVIADGAPDILVAEVSGEIVGFVTFGEARDEGEAAETGELHAINLAPSAWGTGVAGSLLSAAQARLAKRYSRAYLWVLDTNVRAQRFYQKQGWVADNVTQPHRIGDLDVTVMRYSTEL